MLLLSSSFAAVAVENALYCCFFPNHNHAYTLKFVDHFPLNYAYVAVLYCCVVVSDVAAPFVMEHVSM